MIAKHKLAGQVFGALAVLALIAGAAWWIISPRIELQAQRANNAERQLTEARQMIETQALVLVGQQEQINRALDIERQLQHLGQTIISNARQHNRALEELKRNDQIIVDYLAMPVPADLGLLYARPDTTDPAAYRAGPALPAGAVPSAGPAGSGGD